MRTGIFYTSTHGTSEEVAEKIKSELGGSAELIDLNLDYRYTKSFDNVIVGAGVYAGKISKKMKEFLKKNHEDIVSKPHAVYVCCREEGDAAKSYIRENFHLELLQTSSCNAHLGHGITMKKLNFFTRLLFKYHFNIKEDYRDINQMELDLFVSRFTDDITSDNEDK